MKKFLSIFFFLFFFIFKSEAFARMQIVLFGDSLMAGYGLSKPYHLSEVLKLELKNLKVESEVINASVSGDTTRGGLNRIQWTLQDKADLIVLGLGANDMLRGIEPKEIKENLNQIIKSIKNKNIPIVLAGFVACNCQWWPSCRALVRWASVRSALPAALTRCKNPRRKPW